MAAGPSVTPSASVAAPHHRTNPYLGIVGVFLGAGIATLNARLIGVGLPDLRGALGLGVDEASWIPTALNMATAFSGVFVCFLAVLFGPRRILLPAAAIFTVVSALLPFARTYTPLMVLVIVAGLASGTFYSLTMTVVLTALPKRLIIFGIAAYAADIVFISNIASLLEGWFIEHLSWHWIFWTAAVVTPAMMICIWLGIPRKPPPTIRPSWRGFAYFSFGLALVYGALDQGERLYWFNSGIIVAMFAGGTFLLLAAFTRRMIQPNPVLNLAFLKRRNTIILGLSIFVFKFAHLATIILVPGFLSNVAGYRSLQIGHALAWVAVPMLAVVWLVAILVVHTNSRLTLALGLTIAAVACWIAAHLDTSWSGASFEAVELILSIGFACSYIGLVSNQVLEGLESGALASLANAATLSGFLHFIRIFGGQIGVVAMSRLISVREQYHSNLLGLHLQSGNWLADERLRILTGGLLPASAEAQEAQFRAIGILSRQVRAQAYTLAIADGFMVVGWLVVIYLLLMTFLAPAKFNFKDLRNMQ